MKPSVEVIVEAQSAEFDSSVSGTTVTSSAVREALKDAMRQAGLMEAASQTMTAGTYEFTYRGYCSNVTVATTVSETAIEQVEVVSNDETVGIGSYAIERISAAIVEIRLPVWMAFPRDGSQQCDSFCRARCAGCSRRGYGDL